MKKRSRKLAEKAGFIFWANEKWGPGPGNHIDWSPNYDEEIENLISLVDLEYDKIHMRLFYEIEGVITDIKNGLPFDEVCLSTLEKVQKELVPKK